MQGNLEAVVRMTPLLDPEGTGSWLAFYFFNSQTLTWAGPFPILVNREQVLNVGAF